MRDVICSGYVVGCHIAFLHLGNAFCLRHGIAFWLTDRKNIRNIMKMDIAVMEIQGKLEKKSKYDHIFKKKEQVFFPARFWKKQKLW